MLTDHDGHGEAATPLIVDPGLSLCTEGAPMGGAPQEMIR